MKAKRRPAYETAPPSTPAPAYRQEATPLQEATAAVFDALFDARETLSDDEFRALVVIVEERIGIEYARLICGEALRATREVS